MVSRKFKLLVLIFSALLASTETKAKVVFEHQKADTTIDLPEWYMNPPKNYTQNGIPHIFSPSQGMSMERALANAIINLGLKLKTLDNATDQDLTSYEDAFSAKTSSTVNRTIDSIELFGIESVEWEDTSDYSETFIRDFKISYQSGEDFYSIDLEEKEVFTGDDNNYTVSFDVKERNNGFREFLEHLEKPGGLSIREREIIDNEYFLLLEFIKAE